MKDNISEHTKRTTNCDHEIKTAYQYVDLHLPAKPLAGSKPDPNNALSKGLTAEWIMNEGKW